MQKVNIRRLWTGNQGTGGVVILGDRVLCNSFELPWRDNQPRVSCIPCGDYLVQWDPSPKYGYCYELRDVPGRSTILIHSGNLAGDISKSYKTHVQGCIMLGKWFGILNDQRSIKISKPTVNMFNNLMNREDFILSIDFEEAA